MNENAHAKSASQPRDLLTNPAEANNPDGSPEQLWPLKNVERGSGIKRPLRCGITARTHISSGLASELVGVTQRVVGGGDAAGYREDETKGVKPTACSSRRRSPWWNLAKIPLCVR
jgi:hypothetical protein